MLRDHNFYLKEAWRTFRRCSVDFILVPLGLALIAALLSLFCPICGMVFVLPLLFYFIPVGLAFGRPHFYEDNFQPIDGIAAVYIIGFYVTISAVFTVLRVCALLIKDRGQGGHDSSTKQL
jgi:hypothetical protein